MNDLHDLIQKYNQLTSVISDPKNVNNLEELGQELSAIEPLALKAKEIEKVSSSIEENEKLLSSSDEDLKLLAQDEIDSLKENLAKLSDELNTLKKQDLSKEDNNSAIIELRSAAGGDEAKIWADDLLRMYIRFAESLSMKVETLEESTILIKGRSNNPELPYGPYGLFKYESGVHRVQRVPETESQGRIHTSTASVAVLPKVKQNDVVIRDEDLDWQFFRSGGKGGQNVNKVNTAVRLTHNPTGIVIVSTQERYQQRNREIALDLLRSKLWEIEKEKSMSKIDSERKDAVGRGMRAEKIRTYNYPQNRVTDHRINESWHNLPTIMDGDLRDIILMLRSNLE